MAFAPPTARTAAMVTTVVVRRDASLLMLRDHDGNTLLHLAAEADNGPVVEALLDAELPIERMREMMARNARGQTPLHLAVANASNAVIRILLAAVTAEMEDVMAPMLGEASRARHRPGPSRLEDDDDLTASAAAAAAKHDILLQGDPAEDALTLTYAQSGSIAAALPLNAMLYLRDMDGDTVLHYAVRRGSLALAP